MPYSVWIWNIVTIIFLCISDINECSSSPCENGGSCTDSVNGYTCSCVLSYTGKHCETGENFYLLLLTLIKTNLIEG